MSDWCKQLEELGDRFHGVSLEYRRHGTNWPARWRASCVATKNNRQEYRAEVYGNTAIEAIAELIKRTESIEGIQ